MQSSSINHSIVMQYIDTNPGRTNRQIAYGTDLTIGKVSPITTLLWHKKMIKRVERHPEKGGRIYFEYYPLSSMSGEVFDGLPREIKKRKSKRKATTTRVASEKRITELPKAEESVDEQVKSIARLQTVVIEEAAKTYVWETGKVELFDEFKQFVEWVNERYTKVEQPRKNS